MNRTQISLQQAVGKMITGYAVSGMGGMLLMAVGNSEFVEFVADSGDYEWVISGNVGSFCADYYELEELAKVFNADTVQAMRDDRARREAERVLWIAQEQQRREAAAREQVGFNFSGVEIVVDSLSDSKLIYRDWMRGLSGYLGESPIVGPHPKPELSADELKLVGMTDKEKEVMQHLVDFWNGYLSLPDPQATQMVSEAVYVIQGVLAVRVARRVNPEVCR